jgi:hypothetical protein
MDAAFVEELQRLWVQRLHVEEIAKRLHVTTADVYRFARFHRLPKRERVCVREEQDPTPEQIEERKAQIKARHMELMRSRI